MVFRLHDWAVGGPWAKQSKLKAQPPVAASSDPHSLYKLNQHCTGYAMVALITSGIRAGIQQERLAENHPSTHMMWLTRWPLSKVVKHDYLFLLMDLI